MSDIKKHTSNPVQFAHIDNRYGESTCLMFLINTPGISADQTIIIIIYCIMDWTKYADYFTKQSTSVYLCRDKGMYHTQPQFVRVIS